MSGKKLRAVLLNRDAEPEHMSEVFTEEVKARLGQHLELYPTLLHPGNFDGHRDALDEAEVALGSWWMPALDEDESTRLLPRLRAVFYGAGTVQYFARPFLRRGVQVVSAWAANAVPVAEYTVAQIVLANKGFFQNQYRSRRDYAAARAFSGCFVGNYEARVGIIGAGMIGGAVIELLRPYTLKVLVYDPFLSGERAAELGVERCGLDELFSRCNVVSNHVAQLPETEGMLGYRQFSLLAPYATFLNTGRGAQVVEADLVRAMREDATRTAVLDVTDPEPPPKDSPLWNCENILITSHIAGSIGNEMERLGQYMSEEVERYVKGLPLRWRITEEMLKTMA